MTKTKDQKRIDSLESQITKMRIRELEFLRSQLADAEARAEHYRAEAHRNAEAGKQIAAEYEKRLIQVNAELDAMKYGITNIRRKKESNT